MPPAGVVRFELGAPFRGFFVTFQQYDEQVRRGMMATELLSATNGPCAHFFF